MASVRPPAVADHFYPADPRKLEAEVVAHLGRARAALGNAPRAAPPKAVIAPHAGYLYSGPVAASAYVRIAPERVERVVLLGPAHRVALVGLGAPASDAFATPLGAVPIDGAALGKVLSLPQVAPHEAAHREEHSLEVHLPFLQKLLRPFSLVPLLVGDARPEAVAEVLETLWGGPETLVLVSSDLSHYHDYATARRIDAETTRVDGA